MMPPSRQQGRIILAPQPYEPQGEKSVFLSGSIDKNNPTWQEKLGQKLLSANCTILNPHRPDWDHTWKQDIEDEKFSAQVRWELDMMEKADVIAIYFSPESQAPLTLLELGLFSRTGKVIVACPKGYWKRGNVQVVCERFGIELVANEEELETEVRKKLESDGNS